MSAALVGSAAPLWRRYVPAVPAALTVAAAGGAFQRVFTWGDVLVPLILAVALGAAGGVAARQAFGPARVPDPPGSEPSDPPEPSDPSQSEARTAVASVVAAAAVLAATLLSVVITAAVLATPGPATFGAAISRGAGSLFGGWSRILTTSVPVPPTPDRLPLFAGSGDDRRSAWAVLAASRRRPGVDALLPAGLVLLIGLLLGVHGPGSLAAVAGPPLAVAAVYLLVVSRPAGEGVVWVPPGRIPAAISTGVVVLVVCLAAGAHLPLATLRQPVNLRAAVSPPVDLSNTPNPLDQLPAWQRENRTVMFTATVDRTWLQAPADWRLVSLNVYDGTGWSSDASATTAGNVLALPPGVSAGLLGPEVHVVVHMRALAAPWVPTTGVPTGVTPADLGFDPGSSDLVRPNGSTGTFALSGRLPEPRRAALDAAGIGSGSSVVALTAVPGCFPATLRGLAARVTAGLQRPDQQAVAIEQVLASKGGFRLSTSATPGSSCARLSAFASTRSGTEEQYATAFALMVRSVGLPSRLAVGFTPGMIDAAGGETVVTGSDATVWPEVELGPLGWVAFDPLPAASGRGRRRWCRPGYDRSGSPARSEPGSAVRGRQPVGHFRPRPANQWVGARPVGRRKHRVSLGARGCVGSSGRGWPGCCGPDPGPPAPAGQPAGRARSGGACSRGVERAARLLGAVSSTCHQPHTHRGLLRRDRAGAPGWGRQSEPGGTG